MALLTQANRKHPEDIAVLIDIAQLKAETGDLAGAREILEALPPEEKLQAHAKQLAARLRFLEQGDDLPEEAALRQRLEENEKDCEALFALAQIKVLNEENAEAMELLLRLLQIDRNFQDGAARTTLIELFDLLGNTDPAVKQYRRKLYTLMY